MAEDAAGPPLPPPVPSASSSDDDDVKAGVGGHHYAWSSETAKRREEIAKLGGQQGPSRIDTAPSGVPPTSPVERSGSAWNSAGTWEDRDVSSKASSTFRDLAVGRALPLSGGDAQRAHLRLVSVPTFDGSVNVVFVRGKCKPGFEISAKVSFELRASSPGAPAGGEEPPVVSSGTASFNDVSDSEGSDVWSSWAVDIDASHDAGVAEAVLASAGIEWAAAALSRDALRKLVRDSSAVAFRDMWRDWVEAVKHL